jgi:DNA-binding transcriptional ArsR family regulator
MNGKEESRKDDERPEPSTSEDDQHQKLYDFWDSLPGAKVLNVPSKVFTSHPVRPAILRILREGMQEDNKATPLSKKTRHALNTKEIRRLLQEKEDIEMSQTNLYFHLNAMKRAGLIQVVSRILEGRHKVAYYGRVARTIIQRDPEDSLETYKRRFEEIGRLIEVKRPGFDTTQLDLMPGELLDIKKRRDRALGEWMASNEALMNAEGIDSLSIFGFLKAIDSVNPEYVQFYRKVADLLEL